MRKTWVIRLELARDDNGALSDEGITDLLALLTEDGMQPLVTRGESGTVLVQMTVDGRDDRDAGSQAERALRERATQVWLARGLPPFTIAFQEAHQAS